MRLSNHIGIIFPTRTFNKDASRSQDLIDQITLVAGGVTRSEVVGEWLDDDGINHRDHGFQFVWWFRDEEHRLQARTAFTALLVYLKQHEQAVFVFNEKQANIL